MSGPYISPPPHKVPESTLPFIAALSEKEHALHQLAIELLGSSYFVEASHGFVKWQSAQKEATNPKKN